ncbi:hypothetical protein TWF281_001019 [Arthrobotrys megalospora]
MRFYRRPTDLPPRSSVVGQEGISNTKNTTVETPTGHFRDNRKRGDITKMPPGVKDSSSATHTSNTKNHSHLFTNPYNESYPVFLSFFLFKRSINMALKGERVRVFLRDKVFYFKRWYHRVVRKKVTTEVEPHD